VLVKKFEQSVDAHFPEKQAARIRATFADIARLDTLPVTELMATMVTN
jgi:hypothetical protein